MKKKSVPVSVVFQTQKRRNTYSSPRGGGMNFKFTYDGNFHPVGTIAFDNGKEIIGLVREQTTLSNAVKASTDINLSPKILSVDNEEMFLFGKENKEAKTKKVTLKNSIVFVKTGFGGMVPFLKSGREREIREYELGFVVVDGIPYIGTYEDIGESNGRPYLSKCKSNGVSLFDTDKWVHTYKLSLAPVVFPDIGKTVTTFKKEYIDKDSSVWKWNGNQKQYIKQ